MRKLIRKVRERMPGVPLRRWEFILTVAMPTGLAFPTLLFPTVGFGSVMVLELATGNLEFWRGWGMATEVILLPAAGGAVALTALWTAVLLPRERLAERLWLRLLLLAGLLVGVLVALHLLDPDYGIPDPRVWVRQPAASVFWLLMLVPPLWSAARCTAWLIGVGRRRRGASDVSTPGSP